MTARLTSAIAGAPSSCGDDMSLLAECECRVSGSTDATTSEWMRGTMWGRRFAPAIDCVVMARFRGQPVNLYLHNGHRIDGGVARHVGTATVEVLRNTGAAVVDLAAIAVVESLVPESAWAEFPLPGEDRTGGG